MDKYIRYLLLVLIIALGIFIWVQYNNSSSSSTMTVSKEGFANTNSDLNKQKIQSILNNKNNRNDNESNSLLNDNNTFYNPMDEDINTVTNTLGKSQKERIILDELIKDVNTGNNLIVDSARGDLYRSKAESINSAPQGKYRKISYKDSSYRYDFDDNGSSPSVSSQEELDSMYNDALVFRNNEYDNNNNFTGFNETPDDFGNANLKDFTASGKQTQQEKVLSLYNSNNYLPNENLLDTNLAEGFQIVDNPVSVSNPNLIPVMKSIPVSSVLGSNKNSTYDIRAEPPCPKTVVSPFLNSTIMPDIYATNRGCL